MSLSFHDRLETTDEFENYELVGYKYTIEVGHLWNTVAGISFGRMFYENSSLIRLQADGELQCY